MLTRREAVFRRTAMANLTIWITPLAHVSIIVEAIYIFWSPGTAALTAVSTAIMEFFDINLLHIALSVHLAVAMALQTFPLNSKTDMIFFPSGAY